MAKTLHVGAVSEIIHTNRPMEIPAREHEANFKYCCSLCRQRKKSFQMGQEQVTIKREGMVDKVVLNDSAYLCLDHGQPPFPSQAKLDNYLSLVARFTKRI